MTCIKEANLGGCPVQVSNIKAPLGRPLRPQHTARLSGQPPPQCPRAGILTPAAKTVLMKALSSGCWRGSLWPESREWEGTSVEGSGVGVRAVQTVGWRRQVCPVLENVLRLRKMPPRAAG